MGLTGHACAKAANGAAATTTPASSRWNARRSSDMSPPHRVVAGLYAESMQSCACGAGRARMPATRDRAPFPKGERTMHLVTLRAAHGGHPGVLVGEDVLDLVAAAPIIPTAKLVPPTMKGLLEGGDE